MELAVTADVNPTESKNKVLKALENIFPNLDFTDSGSSLQAKGKDQSTLEAFKKHLQIQQIRDSARAFLAKRADGGALSFELNKQAALMGKVSFVDFDVPLGAIEIEIKGKDLDVLVDWLTSTDA
jgi:hypothetical protein